MGGDIQEFCLRWNNHHSTLVSVLDALLERETLVDVMLAAEGQFVKVHRLVLCACSQYFEELLSQQCDKQAVVFLKDVRFIDLKALVDYMYRGEVNVAQDQLAAFLHTAEALKIKGLADKDDHHKSVSSPPGSGNSRKGKMRIASKERSVTPPRIPSPSTSLKRSESPKPTESLSNSVKESNMSSTSRTNPTLVESVITTDMESDDHFIAVDPKLETEMESDLNVDQLESTDNWTNKEGDEEWSNSDVLSATSATDTPSTNPANFAASHESWSTENAAGPSGSKPSANANSTLPLRAGSRSSSSDCMSCTSCGRIYSNRRNYVRHKRYECGQEPSFICHICNSRFKRKDNLKLHHQRRHPKIPMELAKTSHFIC